MSDPYQILGLKTEAGEEEIVAAWRAKTQRNHPDAPGGSLEFQQALNDAKDRAIALASKRASRSSSGSTALVPVTERQNELSRIQDFNGESTRREMAADRSLKRALDLSLAPHRKLQRLAISFAFVAALFSLLSIEKISPLANMVFPPPDPDRFIPSPISSIVERQKAKLSIAEMKMVSDSQIVALQWRAWLADAEWTKVYGNALNFPNAVAYLQSDNLPPALTVAEFNKALGSDPAAFHDPQLAPSTQQRRTVARATLQYVLDSDAAQALQSPDNEWVVASAIGFLRNVLSTVDSQRAASEAWEIVELTYFERMKALDDRRIPNSDSIHRGLLGALGIAFSLRIDAARARTELRRRIWTNIVTAIFGLLTVGFGIAAAFANFSIANTRSRVEHLDSLLSNRDSYLELFRTVVREMRDQGWTRSEFMDFVHEMTTGDTPNSRIADQFEFLSTTVRRDVGARDFVDLLIAKGVALGLLQISGSTKNGFPEQFYILSSNREFGSDET